jgi:hypothetical protein
MICINKYGIMEIKEQCEGEGIDLLPEEKFGQERII